MIRRNIYHMTWRAVMALAIWAVVSPVAFADISVSAARIVRLGIDTRFEGPMVQLEDMTANPQWTGIRQFYLKSDLGNPGLATMLTAFSLGENVWVRIAGTGEEGSLITIIFVNAPAPTP